MPVPDIDRAKHFYKKMGFRPDIITSQLGLPDDAIYSHLRH